MPNSKLIHIVQFSSIWMPLNAVASCLKIITTHFALRYLLHMCHYHIWIMTSRYKSSTFLPLYAIWALSAISASSEVFCAVDISGYLTCIGLSGQGKRKIMLAEAWTLIRRAPSTAGSIVCAGIFLFTRVFVCLFVSRCSRKEACEKWAEPLHFSTELKQCVDITVTPDNMSVTSVSTQVTLYSKLYIL